MIREAKSKKNVNILNDPFVATTLQDPEAAQIVLEEVNRKEPLVPDFVNGANGPPPRVINLSELIQKARERRGQPQMPQQAPTAPAMPMQPNMPMPSFQMPMAQMNRPPMMGMAVPMASTQGMSLQMHQQAPTQMPAHMQQMPQMPQMQATGPAQMQQMQPQMQATAPAQPQMQPQMQPQQQQQMQPQQQQMQQQAQPQAQMPAQSPPSQPSSRPSSPPGPRPPVSNTTAPKISLDRLPESVRRLMSVTPGGPVEAVGRVVWSGTLSRGGSKAVKVCGILVTGSVSKELADKKVLDVTQRKPVADLGKRPGNRTVLRLEAEEKTPAAMQLLAEHCKYFVQKDRAGYFSDIDLFLIPAGPAAEPFDPTAQDTVIMVKVDKAVGPEPVMPPMPDSGPPPGDVNQLLSMLQNPELKNALAGGV